MILSKLDYQAFDKDATFYQRQSSNTEFSNQYPYSRLGVFSPPSTKLPVFENSKFRVGVFRGQSPLSNEHKSIYHQAKLSKHRKNKRIFDNISDPKVRLKLEFQNNCRQNIQPNVLQNQRLSPSGIRQAARMATMVTSPQPTMKKLGSRNHSLGAGISVKRLQTKRNTEHRNTSQLSQILP